MKKLLILAFITTSMTFGLTSCSPDSDYPLQSEQSVSKVQKMEKVSPLNAKMDAYEQEIFDQIVSDIKVGVNTERFNYAGRYRIICHTNWFSHTGDVCFETPRGNYNVHWQPTYSHVPGNPNLGVPVDTEFNPIIFSGSWGCRC